MQPAVFSYARQAFLLEFKQRAFFYSFWCASALMGLWYVLSTYMGTSMVVLQIPAIFSYVGVPSVRVGERGTLAQKLEEGGSWSHHADGPNRTKSWIHLQAPIPSLEQHSNSAGKAGAAVADGENGGAALLAGPAPPRGLRCQQSCAYWSPTASPRMQPGLHFAREWIMGQSSITNQK